MPPIKSILMATDFSASANNAMRRAALLAQAHGASLRIVHVVPRGDGRLRQWLSPTPETDIKLAQAQTRLRRLAMALASQYDLLPDIEVRTGDIVEELNQALLHADLLVVGNRRKHPLARLVRGQTEQRLVAHCRRPMLMVKQLAESGYRRVLLPIDFTPASETAAAAAGALARGIDLQVFHAFDSVGEIVMRETDVSETVIRACRANEEAALTARMRRSMNRVGLDCEKLSFAFGRGSPLKAMLAQANTFSADVLVAVTSRRGRFSTAVLGNINGLLTGSSCDMLIVPGWVPDSRQTEALAPVPPMAQGTCTGTSSASNASTTHGLSWMRAQSPAARFSASQQVRPAFAGGSMAPVGPPPINRSEI